MGISKFLFNQTFTPQTLTETSDNAGGFTKAWADGTAFRGRLSSLPVNERMSSDKATVYSSHKIYCDNQTITESQRIRNSDSTRFFEVRGIVNPSDANHHLEITVLEVDG